MDKDKLERLSIPKKKAEKVEENKEVNLRREEATQFINNVYKTKEQGLINDYVSNIEGLGPVRERIDEYKWGLQVKIKEFNLLKDQVRAGEQKLTELKDQQTYQSQDEKAQKTVNHEREDIQDKLEMELL